MISANHIGDTILYGLIITWIVILWFKELDQWEVPLNQTIHLQIYDISKLIFIW